MTKSEIKHDCIIQIKEGQRQAMLFPMTYDRTYDDQIDHVILAITIIIILVIAITMTLCGVDDNVRSSRLIGGRELWGRDVTPTQGLPNILMEFFIFFLVYTHKHFWKKKKYFHFYFCHIQSTTIHLTDRPRAGLTG